jgi:hypothetical protein
MSQFLKQSTAATIMFGPFVDKTDGVTLEVGAGIITSIDHATTGIFLSKNGGTAAIRNQSVTASVLDAYGMFKVTLDTTDTNTVGTLDVLMAEAATFLPVHKTFMVLPANVYDSLMGTDYLQVDAIQWLGVAPLALSSQKVQTAVVTNGDKTGYALSAAGLTAVENEILDVGTTSHTSAGTVGETLHSIKDDDASAMTKVAGSILHNVDALVSRLTATRATYLDYLFSIYFGLVTSVAQAQGGAAGSITLAATASAVIDFYKGQTVVIYTGTGAGQARAISAYTGGATKVATVTPNWATAPDATSWYVIINVGSAIIDDWIDGGRLDLILDSVKQVLTGNWEMKDNQLIMYDTDGTTPIYTFNLSRDGDATMFNPTKRVIV